MKFLRTLVCVLTFYSVESTLEGPCLGELGCFPITKDFIHVLHRPLNFPVFTREKIHTTFLHFTRETRDCSKNFVGYELTHKHMEDVTFNASKPTKFFVGGFIETMENSSRMKEFKDAMLDAIDCNFFIVDWSGGNHFPYLQATVNTRVVGAEVAVFIEKLQSRFNLNLTDVHLIGHSLGSHIMGYAGKRLCGKIGRITGADPAQPFFQGMPTTVRLCREDALFVEAFHTDGSEVGVSFGFREPLAHVDYYPNGGSKMPGCTSPCESNTTFLLFDGLGNVPVILGACDHIRSVLYIKNSLKQQKSCMPVAYKCPDYETFESGMCSDCGEDGSNCIPIGLESQDYFQRFINRSHSSVMFYDTSATPDFCLFHYSIELKMRTYCNCSEVVPSVKGKFQLTLQGAYDVETFVLWSTPKKLRAGQRLTALLKTTKNLGLPFRKIELQFTSTSRFRKNNMELESLRVIPMNSAVPKGLLETNFTTVCARESLATNHCYELSKDYCVG